MNIKAMSITLVRQLQLNMCDVILEVTVDQKNMWSFDENVHFDMGTYGVKDNTVLQCQLC